MEKVNNQDASLQEEPPKPRQQTDIRGAVSLVSSRGFEQKGIFIISVFLFAFFSVLLAQSILTKSTVFVQIAFIQLLHFALYAIILLTDYYTTLPPDECHTYGYARSMIVCCFSVSLTVILFACSLLLDSLKEFLSSVAPDASLSVEHPSFSPVMPNIFALIAYGISALLLSQYRSNPSQSKYPHFHAAFLVAISGILHSLSKLVTAFLPFPSVPEHVSEQAIPLLNGLIALFIIDRARELLVPSFFVLMQATPEKLLEITDYSISETFIDKMVREVSHFEGVLDCKAPHFWGLTFTDYVGSLHIRAKNDANEQHIIQQAHAKFDPIVGHFTAQVDKDHWDTTVRDN
ncbi:cation diffusion facilitator family transporter containing protein [Trichomonas vaginalis G3]|uniref:Cation diffusion facilitator family transporter containing protein n=1 Tax=Trichomonas vaginalis (strain ATCC PRA-98 / G3) TaxID=412133 RepID=A2F1G7_TRIV3|nr:regulation of sequestering of zinc ion [Trichomonas vaginalis G3]EAY01254.1 cation diffusion facilitator family transporter containing protein [Trichomonas vaginalis G3]KAI5486995.1 regulation of sequestering of zinc ion [Trichomonas vaginalis G3]|eukprot:XP_001314069.1 cation diffusion facilitator family transporter containing protein [Trichomonas vaginalis G3]